MVIIFTWKKFNGSESHVLGNSNYFLFTYKKSPINMKLNGIKIVKL